VTVYAKGPKGKADRLFSLVVRARGACERCGESDYSKLQCAHIRRREFVATRTMELNAWCLCAGCHLLTHAEADEFMDLVEQTIGLETYFELKTINRESSKRWRAADWEAECVRLRAVLDGATA
jgi:hypothetical protein